MSTDIDFTGSVPELYDACLGPMLFEPFARDLGRRFEGFSGDLLETAAGTGRVTRALSEAAPRARIVATDLNEPMLLRASREIVAPNIEWRVADAQALPFADEAFDAMVCQFGVMFFPDKAAGHAQARRVLRPGGRYLLSVWDDLETNDISAETHRILCDFFPENPPGFLRRTPFGHSDREALITGLKAAGFTHVEAETVRLPTRSSSATEAARGLCLGSPLTAEIQTRGPEVAARAVEAVALGLAERFGDGDPSGPILGTGQSVLMTATA